MSFSSWDFPIFTDFLFSYSVTAKHSHLLPSKFYLPSVNKFLLADVFLISPFHAFQLVPSELFQASMSPILPTCPYQHKFVSYSLHIFYYTSLFYI